MKDSFDDNDPSSKKKTTKFKLDPLYNNSIIQNSLDNNSRGSKLNDDIYSRHLSLEGSMHSNISKLIKYTTVNKVSQKTQTENGEKGAEKINEDNQGNNNANPEEEIPNKKENENNNENKSNDMNIKINTIKSKQITNKENNSIKISNKKVSIF